MLTVLALLVSAAAPAIPPRNVYVGTYLSDVSDFDLKGGRFKADLRVWVKWLGDDTVPDVTFENGEVDSKEELGREHDAAWHSVQWRVQGTFRGDFPVNAFPFDRQTLPVIFGLNSSDGVLVPDLGASGMSPSFSITGWSYEPAFSARAEERVYRSDLGSVADEGKDSHQRRAVFSVEMKRPFGPYLIKFALPLALILLVALLALLLPAERLDVRSAMGITALLSCIAFHYTQADTLPNVTYLVAADKLFLGAYVFVAATLVLSIASFRLNDQRPLIARSADRAGLWLLPGISVVGLVVLLSTSLTQPAHATVPLAERPSFPELRVAVATLEGQVPEQRAAMVVRGADGAFRPLLADEAPAMTNALVRLLPDGGMRIRWRLREDAKWSDASPITAEDLEFSITQVKEPLRVKVERLDARTIEVTYTARRSEWLSGFTVLPAKGTVTSTPWTVTALEEDKHLTLTRNPKFSGVRPLYERVEVTVMDPLEGARALLAGKIDVLPSLTPDSYELLKGQRGVRVLEQPGELTWMLVPNLATPPWDSLEVRREVLASLDRVAMVKDFAPAPTRVAWGWRALPVGKLKSSGATLAARAVTLNVPPIGSQDEVHALLSRRIVADLAKVGLTVTVVEREDLQSAVEKGDFQDFALLSNETGNPGRFMNVAALDVAAGPHFDDEMVERYEYYESTLYTERRDFLAAAMQEAWFERLPMLPLVLTSRLSAVRAELQGPEWGQADSLWWNVADWRPR